VVLFIIKDTGSPIKALGDDKVIYFALIFLLLPYRLYKLYEPYGPFLEGTSKNMATALSVLLKIFLMVLFGFIEIFGGDYFGDYF